VQITVKASPEHVAALHAEASTPEARALRETLDEQGVSLSPMHPSVDDPALASYFTVDVDDSRVDAVLDALHSSAAIEAAYVKPADELP
jgi:hypothetical protein